VINQNKTPAQHWQIDPCGDSTTFTIRNNGFSLTVLEQYDATVWDNLKEFAKNQSQVKVPTNVVIIDPSQYKESIQKQMWRIIPEGDGHVIQSDSTKQYLGFVHDNFDQKQPSSSEACKYCRIVCSDKKVVWRISSIN